MGNRSFLTRLRDTAHRWRLGLASAGFVVACGIGTRIGIPGVDGKAVHDFINAGHFALLWLYDFIGGGGVARGSLVALGVLPYVSTRIYLWLGRTLSPAIRRRTDDERTESKVIRIMTAGLACIQGLGFTAFLSTVPNAVANPGAGFFVRTVVLLTGSAIVESLLLDKILRRSSHMDPVDAPPEAAIDVDQSRTDSAVLANESATPLALPAGEPVSFTTRETRAPVSIE